MSIFWSKGTNSKFRERFFNCVNFAKFTNNHVKTRFADGRENNLRKLAKFTQFTKLSGMYTVNINCIIDTLCP